MQIVSVVEVQANAAVAKTYKLVDGDYAFLQISRGQKENDALKTKLRELESRKEHGCEMIRAGPERRPSGNNPSGTLQVCETQSGETCDRSYVSQVDVYPLENREVKPADGPSSPFMNNEVQNSYMSPQLGTGREEGPESVCIKEEMLEDDLEVRDQEDEVKITGDTIKTTALKSDEESTKHNKGGNSVLKASEQGSIFKEEMQNETNRGQTDLKGDVGELNDLGAFPSHGVKDEEIQNPTCRCKSENLSVCTEAQMFYSRDKSLLLVGVHTEDKEREAFMLGNGKLCPLNSHMTMGEDSASKSNIPHVNRKVSGDDQLAKPRSVRSHCRGGARGRQFICTYCGKGLACGKDLKKHQRVHKGEKSFPCMQCGKSFIFFSHLKTHQRVHTGEKLFTCTLCGKSFIFSSHLKIHQTVHTGEKPFTCTQCGKSFIFSSYLMRHQRVHTGEKPFTCTQCGKSFGQSSGLTVHLRIHTGEKPFTCTQCGRSFSILSHLEQHHRVHTGKKPFTCTQCGKSFGQSSALTVHLRTHTGNKPFTCRQCGKSFGQSGSLTVHLRTHTGEKPFTCTRCSRSFSALSSLKRHQRVHIGD